MKKASVLKGRNASMDSNAVKTEKESDSEQYKKSSVQRDGRQVFGTSAATASITTGTRRSETISRSKNFTLALMTSS